MSDGTMRGKVNLSWLSTRGAAFCQCQLSPEGWNLIQTQVKQKVDEKVENEETQVDVVKNPLCSSEVAVVYHLNALHNLV